LKLILPEALATDNKEPASSSEKKQKNQNLQDVQLHQKQISMIKETLETKQVQHPLQKTMESTSKFNSRIRWNVVLNFSKPKTQNSELVELNRNTKRKPKHPRKDLMRKLQMISCLS